MLYEFVPLSCNTLKNKVGLAIFSSPLSRRVCLSPVQWSQDLMAGKESRAMGQQQG
jgi:hypothetical protein